MQRGQVATDLLKELHRSKKSLPPYNSDALQRVVQETSECAALIRSQKEGVGGVGLVDELLPALVLEAACIGWNKRCGLAYLHERLSRVKALWWDTTGVLPAPAQSGCVTAAHAEMREGMASHELRFFDAYNALVSQYMEGSGIAVSGDFLPPRSVWVVVQVLRSVEPIVGSDGNPIRLTAGNRKRMRRSDAENLIRQHIVRVAE